MKYRANFNRKLNNIQIVITISVPQIMNPFLSQMVDD